MTLTELQNRIIDLSLLKSVLVLDGKTKYFTRNVTCNDTGIMIRESRIPHTGERVVCGFLDFHKKFGTSNADVYFQQISGATPQKVIDVQETRDHVCIVVEPQ